MSKVCIGNVIQRIKNKVNKDETDLEYYVGGEHFDSGEIAVTRFGKIAGSTIGPAFNTCFGKGDVLLMSRNPHLRKAGMVDFDGICSDVSYICRTRDESILLQEFIPFIYQSDAFWEFAEANKRGSTNFFLNWSDFERYEFELPSLAKQKELVEVLWAAYRTKKSYQNLIKSTDELVKSQFIEMFEKCDRVALGGYIEQVRGVSYKPSDLSLELDASHITLLRANNIDGQKIIFDDLQFVSRDKVMPQQIIKKGDILLCGSSGSLEHVGKAAIFNENGEFTFGAFCKLIRTTGELKPQFIAAFMNSKEYRDKIKEIACGTNINNLRNEHIDDLMIPYPEADAQEAFIAFKVQSDKSKLILSHFLDRKLR